MPQVPGLPGETLTNYYDTAGNPDGVGGWTGVDADVTRSPYGEPLRLDFAAEVGKFAWQSFTYEEGTRRLSTMNIDREGQASADDIFQYTHDQAGNKYAITHTAKNVGVDRQCYRVDHLRRMSNVWTPSGGTCTTGPSVSALGGPIPYWHSFSYSASGNRTTMVDHRSTGNTTKTSAYPAATAARPHGVTGVTSTGPSGTAANSYAYDAAGNLATRTEGGASDTFSWDAEGHLASMSGPGGVTSFLYDAGGSRLIKRDPAGATLYLGGTEVRWDKVTDSVSSTRYYGFNGDTVAMRTSATQLEFLMADHHGTATIGVDAHSEALSRRFADPFGNVRAQSATWEPNSHGFVDGVIDGSTRLTHLGAREYDPKLGRFISVDPLIDPSDPQALNGYAYGNYNPATFTGPDGLANQCECGGRGGGTTTPPQPPPPVEPPTVNQQVSGSGSSSDGDSGSNSGSGGGWSSVKSGVKAFDRAAVSVGQKASRWLRKNPNPQEYIREQVQETAIGWWQACANGPTMNMTSCKVRTGELALMVLPGWGTAAKTVTRPLTAAVVKEVQAAGHRAAISAASEKLAKASATASAKSTARTAPPGVVYRRTDLLGGKPYIGQARSEERYLARQSEHARGDPAADFEFEIIGRANPGAELDRMEEFFIRSGGGPTNVGNPDGGLANLRHQMSDPRYRSAGGDLW